MRFVIYGAGAIGGGIGARLVQGGQDVTLIARGEHYAAIRDYGLRLDTPDDTVTVKPPVADRPGSLTLADGDVVILAMKTQHTSTALTELAATAPPGITVVCAQNGVENERLALRLFGNVYGVCVVAPMAHMEPGVVQSYSAPVSGILDIGRYPDGSDDTAEAIAAAFRSGGFGSEARPEIMRYKYGKLLANLGNAVEAICGTTDREIAESARAEGRACLRAAGIEAINAGYEAAGIKIRPVGDGPRAGGSSTQSLARGSGSIEADYLNGEIVLLGRLHAVPTPVNEVLARTADRMARTGQRPGALTVGELRAAVG
jgi:2-dehydropantoate 2-reductase